MANYTIIGGDQKQYGPVTEEQLRQWIADGRLNAQSQVKAEGDAEWQSALGISRIRRRARRQVRRFRRTPTFDIHRTAPAGKDQRPGRLRRWCWEFWACSPAASRRCSD